MKLSLYNAVLLAGALLMGEQSIAQDELFIYGKVKTEDGRLYEGPIRWGKEEAYWTDIFNASKLKNEYLKFLSDEDRSDLNDRRYSGDWFSWDDSFRWMGSRNWSYSSSRDYVHQFSSQFGDIKSLRPTGREYVEVEMRNGQKFEVSGEGYNDIGLDIRVTDKELGEVELHWARIESVEFMNTPAKLENKFGKPLYGTVEAYGDKFTGYIQWDHDERLSVDKLDGDSDDGDVSVAFDKIRSIERRGNRSLVILKSGRELYLGGSNDVNSSNRGVIVMSKEFPAIDIPWDEFDKVTFEDKVDQSLAGYDQYPAQKELTGKVITRSGKTLEGKIVYDLDEAYDYELFQGKDGDFEFTTVFRNIKSIKPKSVNRATIELRNGKTITLDDAQDVGERNQGLLVFTGKGDPQYVTWRDVEAVIFK